MVKTCPIVGGKAGLGRMNSPGECSATQPTRSEWELTVTRGLSFPFLRLSTEIQLRILELVLTDDFLHRSGPRIDTVPYKGSSRPVIRGLRLPREGVLEVSREVRALSLQVLYHPPETPPVYLSRWTVFRLSAWPLDPVLWSAVVGSNGLVRATFWRRVMMPLRTC